MLALVTGFESFPGRGGGGKQRWGWILTHGSCSSLCNSNQLREVGGRIWLYVGECFFFLCTADLGDSWHGRRRGRSCRVTQRFSFLHLKALKAVQNNLFFTVIFFFFYFSADKMTRISNKEIISQEGQELEISSVPFTSPLLGPELAFISGRKTLLSPISPLISF